MGSLCFKSTDLDGSGCRPTATVKPHVRPSGTLRPNALCTCGAQDTQALRVSTGARVEEHSDSHVPGVFETHDITTTGGEYMNTCFVDLWDPVQQSLLSVLNDKLALEAEFENIPLGLERPHNIGLTAENLNKNRFKSILPYEDTRVVLREYMDGNASDYINASFIQGYKREKGYIAAQGPKENTTTDFWRMVWQERVTHIVMLTNCEEGKRDKCDEYWPPPCTSMEYGPFVIAGLEVVDRADYEIRMFELVVQHEKRRVIQYHYFTWPDHSTPKVTELVDFWRRVRTDYRLGNGGHTPLLVHCSAGVGRTGSFIALDIAMDYALQECEVSVCQVVTDMRTARCNMVQAKDQYEFVYKAVLEAYSAYSSRLLLDTPDVTLPHVTDPYDEHQYVDAEIQMLLQMKKLDHKPVYTSATSEDNIRKNRNIEVLPDENHLVYLTCRVEERNQYINAVYFSSFADWNGWVLTQLPLAETVVDLWRLVHGAGISIIVALGSDIHTGDEVCYWPRQPGEQKLFGPLEVAMISHGEFGQESSVYELTVTFENEAPQNVRLYHLGKWEQEIPGSTADILSLADVLASSEDEEIVPPVLVQCTDGACRSGVFCALCDVISRVKYDRELDVYTTVRKLHVVRPEGVNSKVQYRFLYQAASQYLASDSVYVNTSG